MGDSKKIDVRGAVRSNLPAGLAFDELTLGKEGEPGKLVLRSGAPKPTVELTAADARLALGGKGVSGVVALHDDHSNVTLELRGQDGRATIGGKDTPGSVSVRDGANRPAVELLALPDESVIGAGQHGRPGRLTMYGEGGATVNLTAADGRLVLGGHGRHGAVSVLGADGLPVIELLGRADESVIGLGQSQRPGRISVYSAKGEAIRIDGAAGDIMIANADCAEEFDLAVAGIAPGTVVVLTDGGAVEPCRAAYSRRVAGVVSGAGLYRPGLVLDRRVTGQERAPIALMGKVYCLVDASDAPVAVGDLLTTSEREGHAMPALDPGRAFGAVIGKALAPLTGVGMIPVLVALQ